MSHWCTLVPHTTPAPIWEIMSPPVTHTHKLHSSYVAKRLPRAKLNIRWQALHIIAIQNQVLYHTEIRKTYGATDMHYAKITLHVLISQQLLVDLDIDAYSLPHIHVHAILPTGRKAQQWQQNKIRDSTQHTKFLSAATPPRARLVDRSQPGAHALLHRQRTRNEKTASWCRINKAI